MAERGSPLLGRPWRAPLLAFGLCAALATGACQNDVERALAAADAANYRGAYTQAEQILRRLEMRLAAADHLRAGPEKPAGPTARRQLHADVLERLAQLNAVQLGNVPQALQDFTALANLEQTGPRAGSALLEVAELLRHRLGQPAQAVPVLRRAAELLGQRPEGAQARRALMTTFVELGNYDAACTEARAVLAAWPQGPVTADARLRLGQAQFLAQRYQEAATTFLQLVDERPGKPLAAMALVEAGHAYQELGEAAQALSYYYAAVKDHPNPLLVQDKIARVRARIYQLEAHRTILQAASPARHVASAARR